MKRKVISLLLCVLMLSALALPALAWETETPYDLEDDFVPRPGGDWEWEDDFVERPGDEWYVSDEWVEDPHDSQTTAESSEGSDDGERNLGLATTRGRATAYIVMARDRTLLNRGRDIPINIAGNRFSDVPMSDWAFPAITWAAHFNWVQGVGSGRFNPTGYVTRQEYAAMLVRVFSSRLYTGDYLNRFTDRSQIAVWAQPYVRRAVQQGWIQGFGNGTFGPTQRISRSDAISMTNRTGSETISDPTPQLITWNQNGGANVVNWHRVPNHAIGPLPTTTRANVSSDRWFNTTNIMGGTQVTANTRMPNGNVTYTLRWFDSSRHMNARWPTNSVPLRASGFNATWQPGINAGMTNWNWSSTPVSFSNNSASVNRVVVANFAWSYLGRAPMVLSGTPEAGRMAGSFTIELNSGEITTWTNNNRATLSNVITHVMAHELGHVQGLADGPGDRPLGGGANNSIMNLNSNPNTITTPRAFDIQSVNLQYR